MSRADKVVCFFSAVAAFAVGYLVWKVPSGLPAPVSWAAIYLPIFLYLAFGSPRALAVLREHAPRRGNGLLAGPNALLIGLGAAAALWIPFEINLFPPLVMLGPSGLDIMPVVLLDLALFLYLAYWKLDGVGFDFGLEWKDVKVAAAEWLKVALPLAGLGFALGFITWAPRQVPLDVILLRPLGIYFLNALPEEFLFRGVMQNLLARHMSRGWALGITSVVFGIAHVNNPWPNWQYVAMATLAGWFYGRAYERTGKCTASALVHTGVNWTWATLFHV